MTVARTLILEIALPDFHCEDYRGALGSRRAPPLDARRGVVTVRLTDHDAEQIAETNL